MRRKFLVTVVFILVFLLATVSTAFAADEQYQIVRVKLSIGQPTEFSFFADGNYTVGETGLERQLYTVKLEGGTLNLYCGSERLASGGTIKLVRHAPIDGRNNFIWMYNERAAQVTGNQTDKFRYLGDMEFSIDNGHIAAVNYVYIEDYLYGVVPWEMSDAFPPEALKAQAVAARNYAETHISGIMTDTSANQVYNGYYYPIKTKSLDAVTQTVGKVLTYGEPGSVIEAFFTASNGGYTDIPLHRWGNGEGWAYYQFSEDSFDTANTESRYETIYFPASFADYGAVTVAASEGTPDKAKAIACIKQAIFENEVFRTAFPGVADRNGFELTGVSNLVAHDYDINGNEDHSRVPGYSENRCVDFIKMTGDFNVLVGGTTPAEVKSVTIDLRYLDGSLASSGNEFKAFNIDALTLFVVAPVKDGDTVLGYSISQKRFGHGIGLSQRGAQQRANSTDPTVNTFDKILEFYYPGTALTTQGYAPPTLSAPSGLGHSNAAVATDLVNIRSGPATSYSSINKLPNGARIEVVQADVATTSDSKWHKIYYAGQYAYIAANYKTTPYVQLDGGTLTRTPLTVSFATNGGSAVSAPTYYHADSITSSPATSKPNYDLEGWYFDAGLSSKATFPCILTRDTTLNAKWTPTLYSIGYDLRGGSADNPGGYTVESGAFTLNNPSRNGYAFTGWTGTGLDGPTMSVTIPAGSSGHRAYYANWSPITYSIYYNLNGGNDVSNPGSYTADSGAITLSNPSKYGYTFTGWTGTGLSSPTTNVTIPTGSWGSRTYYANWTPTSYSIGYDLRGGSADNPGGYTVESGAFTLNNPTRNGYAFTGWTGTGLDAPTMSVTIPAGSSGYRAYYANWSPITYSIWYNLDGGNDVSNPGSYTIESGDIHLANPIRTGFGFVGWSGTGLSEPTMSVTIPAGSTGDRGYTANWAPYSCTINFDSQGGSSVGGMQKGLWDTIPSEPGTSRFGFNFTGWYTGSGERVSFPYVVRDNVTLYARWEQQPQTNLLRDVGLSSGSLNRGFAKTVTSYKITIGENDGSFTLTPFKEYDGATMTVNGKPYSSYTVSLANGKSATITVKVTYLKKSKTYKFSVTRAKSSNNALSALSVIGGSLSQPFDPNVLNYTLTLDENTKSTTIKAVAAAGKAAKLSPASKKIALNNGQSKDVKITVKAQSGAKRTYTIHVVRAASTNADLKSLKSSGLSPGFSPGNTHYTVVLPANKSAASISAKAGGYKSVVYIDGAKKSSKKVTLASGQSVDVHVTVVSQAGNSKEYVVTVIRQ